MAYHRVPQTKVEETAVLAEIFMLRLETQLRDVNDADQAKILRFVPFPVGTLPALRKNSDNRTEKDLSCRNEPQLT